MESAMPIFKNINGKLQKLSTLNPPREKNLQTLVEQNLVEALGMHFLETEYTTTFGGRIDTLAVDFDGAPVIIEYKRNKNDNIINQGLSYLRWLKAQKKEFFEMLVINTLGKELANKIQIDWKNPRVICIAEAYSRFDMDTVEVVPMRIELFRYRYYEGNIFSLEPLSASEQVSQYSATESIPKSVTGNTTVDLANNDSSPIHKLFKDLRSKIFELDENITEKTTTLYLAYRVTKNFAEVYIQKNQLKIHLRPIDYTDPESKIENVSEKYNWTMDRRVYLKAVEDIDYVMSLIEQSYKDVL